MEDEAQQVIRCLQAAFASASDIYVDTELKECEAKVSVDDFRGEISGKFSEMGITLEMVDFCDTFPYKYVFSYSVARRL
ncbi:MAG: hypothetical protein KKA81_04500 [Bacteroidetes bacterium]|nr:hypothetical protein [Bacteroidota bacterium]